MDIVKAALAALLLIGLGCPTNTFAGDIWLSVSTAAVTGTRVPQPVSRLSRAVTVITSAEIKMSAAASVADIISLAPGAEVQSRSPHGIQADVTLRGSTYQQVLVLVDGVRVNDSQTAHYNMDLPVPLSDVDRVEVLHGQGSSAYGPDALGGVINIITKKIKDNELAAKTKVSDFNTTLYSGSFGKVWGDFGQKVSVEKTKSDGFRYDTDFDNLTVSSKSSLKALGGQSSLNLGFMQKEYGAFDFYTPGRNYPSREWTKTYFAELSHLREWGGLALAPKLFLRHHDDTFMLDQTRPSFSLNNSKTDYYGGEVQADMALGDGTLIFGADAAQEEIESSNMGNHVRPRQGVFSEYRVPLSPDWDLDAALRADNSDWGAQLSPNIGLTYWTSPSWKLRASVGRAFRAPSFTELYYHDPLNQGDPNLKPEEALSYEAGLDFMGGRKFSASLTGFARHQKNLIDWVGASATGPWTAQNIGKVVMYGAEALVNTEIYGFGARFGGSLIGSDREQDYFSKYAFTYPTRQFTLDINKKLGGNVTASVGMLQRSRHNLSSYFLMSGKVAWTCGDLELYVDGSNLLNTGYQAVAGIPQPGRWLGVGANLRLAARK